MKLVPLLFFLLASAGSAQNVDFEGTVLDAKTKVPLPYVNLSFLGTLKGTSTGETGEFSIEISKSLLEGEIHISSLGYKDTIVNAAQLYKVRRLLMTEDVFELNEVVISKDYGASKVLNPILSRGISSGFNSSSTPWIVALYFPNIGASKKKVEKVNIFFRDNPYFKRDRAKFRLRFFGVDATTKKPSKDLIQKSLVLEAVKGQSYTTIDLTGLQLQIPRQGMFVGLEWLFVPYNWYPKSEKDQVTQKSKLEDRFAPTFGGVYSKNSNLKVMVYGMGQWQDFEVRSKIQGQHLIPAVSVKITEH
ncbi:Hypothetical protein I595_2092 [Croceitalea dokdonensis DOKDO 023]|uniref:Carboxypeptidase-like regulatory domain-containing protein n=1 Tax=Croceitalea dokdonensis DOKDO 023 TaxID=1300341 RepID=A0A0P7A533_9FLAO|nr:carboxypeptidase-like regulatory domain-containing protein [Croceitalea dokdonensis]KPM31598.1 Hypothetical protein I595_2092 [Croceitalea dokdonensis DOKDO 023]